MCVVWWGFPPVGCRWVLCVWWCVIGVAVSWCLCRMCVLSCVCVLCPASGDSEASGVGELIEDFCESTCVGLLWCVELILCGCGPVCSVRCVSWWVVCVWWLGCLVVVVVVSVSG